jgi:hypothetical protein
MEHRDLQTIQNPVTGTEQQKLAQLDDLTRENEEVLDAFFEVFLEKFGHCVQFKHNRKSWAAIIGKSKRPSILESKPWHNIEHIRDSFRFKAVVMGFDEAFLVLQSILVYELIPGATPIKLDIQKCLKPRRFGWRFIGLDLQMENGQLVELYIPFLGMDETKQRVGHLIFEKWRNLEQEHLDKRRAEYELDLARSSKAYDKAWREVLRNTSLEAYRSFWYTIVGQQKGHELMEQLEKELESMDVHKVGSGRALHKVGSGRALRMAKNFGSKNFGSRGGGKNTHSKRKRKKELELEKHKFRTLTSFNPQRDRSTFRAHFFSTVAPLDTHRHNFHPHQPWKQRMFILKTDQTGWRFELICFDSLHDTEPSGRWKINSGYHVSLVHQKSFKCAPEKLNAFTMESAELVLELASTDMPEIKKWANTFASAIEQAVGSDNVLYEAMVEVQSQSTLFHHFRYGQRLVALHSLASPVALHSLASPVARSFELYVLLYPFSLSAYRLFSLSLSLI